MNGKKKPMRTSIAEIISRAREILAEPNVVSVALAVYKRHTFRQLADLHWLGDDEEDVCKNFDKRAAERVAGILAIEKDGISFECSGNTSAEQARSIIKGFMAANDWRAIKSSLMGRIRMSNRVEG